MQFTSTQKRATAWGLIAVFSAVTLWLLAPVLTPFVVAAILAYALTPLVDWLDRLGRGRLPRMVAVVVIELVFILVVLGVMLLIVPILAKELPLMREQVPVLLDGLNASLKPFLAQFGLNFSLDVASLKAFVMKYLSANLEDACSYAWTQLVARPPIQQTKVKRVIVVARRAAMAGKQARLRARRLPSKALCRRATRPTWSTRGSKPTWSSISWRIN